MSINIAPGDAYIALSIKARTQQRTRPTAIAFDPRIHFSHTDRAGVIGKKHQAPELYQSEMPLTFAIWIENMNLICCYFECKKSDSLDPIGSDN